ncbi:acyl-CoA thioesterase [Gammaproteobacteria bacterium]|nr:acyl-CoA thioesterase [Gammaproteobacteria bacterium]
MSEESNHKEHEVSETEFPVRYAETDAMGVVHHAAYIVYFEEARSQYMRDRRNDYALIEKSGYRLPVTDVKVRYVGSLTYGDRVNIRAWITENRSRTITFNYEIRSSANSAILVSGSTSHAWTNLEGKVTRAPSVWLNL